MDRSPKPAAGAGGDDEEDDDETMADSAPKTEHARDGTPSSVDSTQDQESSLPVNVQDPPQPQKRKGGRKPIYATSEERKQRNRQAQAAFRERRTEYIKQLEATIKQNEDTLSTLQQSHRTAADECLMLRYKNSLLERILLEKGIDVRAELRLKTGSPVMGHPFPQPATGPQAQQPQSALQRTALQRQHARRSAGQVMPPKLAPGHSNSDLNMSTSSPQGVPTPSSHASSPTNISRSPMAMQQGGMTPPLSAVLSQPQQQQFGQFPRSPLAQSMPDAFTAPTRSPASQRQQVHSKHRPNTSSVHSRDSVSSQYRVPQHAMNMGSSHPAPSSYYPSPFQKHIDQLEQEYDIEQRSMLGHDSNPPPNQVTATYAAQYDSAQQQMFQTSHHFYNDRNDSGQPSGHFDPGEHHSHEQLMGMHPSMGTDLDDVPPIDPNDPMLDADPFGLSASMHYPTSYPAMDQQQQISR